MLISLFFHLSVSLASCEGVYGVLRRVPEGYQDEGGFHFGAEPAAWSARLFGFAGPDHR